MAKVLFSHIPKTAGSSMREAVFPPFIEEGREVFQGFRGFLSLSTDFQFLRGHYPYGLHWLRPSLWGQVRQFVMLRDPVERAISHYYFIRNTSHADFKHPSLEDATSHSLTDFCRLPHYQNLQVRYVAGLPHCLVMRRFCLSGMWRRLVLRTAKFHLRSGYEAFGLAERFEASANLFASKLGVKASIPERRHKETPNRPSRSDIDQATLSKLRKLNAGDMELYNFAKEHFSEQRDSKKSERR
jgi:hypothetical protein